MWCGCRKWEKGEGNRGGRRRRRHRRHHQMQVPTGNTAFDAYREDVLKKLEEERDAFIAYIEALRAAKDRADFEQFMAEQGRHRAADDNGPSAS